MNIDIYKELIKLINNHCQWAIVVNNLYPNKEYQYSRYNKKKPKALYTKFRIGSLVAENKDTVPIWEWKLEKSLSILESDNDFKHRVQMHACTPDDADHWLQIAVFGNILFK